MNRGNSANPPVVLKCLKPLWSIGRLFQSVINRDNIWQYRGSTGIIVATPGSTVAHRRCTVVVREYSGNITSWYTHGEATICHGAVTVLPRYTPDALGWSYGLPRLIRDAGVSHRDQSAWIVAHRATSLTCQGHTVATSACSMATTGCSGVIRHIKRGYTVGTPGIWDHNIIFDKK